MWYIIFFSNKIICIKTQRFISSLAGFFHFANRGSCRAEGRFVILSIGRYPSCSLSVNMESLPVPWGRRGFDACGPNKKLPIFILFSIYHHLFVLLLTGSRGAVKAHNGKLTNKVYPELHHEMMETLELCLLLSSGKIKRKKWEHEEFDFNHIHKRQMKTEVSLILCHE